MSDKAALRKQFNHWLGYDFDKQNKSTEGQTNRWVFCYNSDDEDCYDCACCLSDEELDGCGCICHVRIGQIVDFFYKTLKEMKE